MSPSFSVRTTAWISCCASFPPRLYVASTADHPAPKCAVKAVGRHVESRLRSAGHLVPFTKAATRIQEVVDHPLLALLAQVNPIHNALLTWALPRRNLIYSAFAVLLIPAAAIVPVQALHAPAKLPSTRSSAQCCRRWSGCWGWRRV
jgi:hypothetical protein